MKSLGGSDVEPMESAGASAGSDDDMKYSFMKDESNEEEDYEAKLDKM